MNRKLLASLFGVLCLLGSASGYCEVSMDGTDDLFDCGSPSDLDNVWPASISMRAYVPTGGEGYLIKKLGGGAGDWGWYTGSDGAIGFFQGGTTTFFSCSTAASAFDFDEWHTFGVTWNAAVDSSCSGITPYIDGVAVSWSSSSGSGTRPNDAAGNFYINHDSDSANGVMTLSTASVIGRVATADEMLNIHNAQKVLAPLQIAGDDILRVWWPNHVASGGSYDGVDMIDLMGNGNCTGDDGANDSGLTAGEETGLAL